MPSRGRRRALRGLRRGSGGGEAGEAVLPVGSSRTTTSAPARVQRARSRSGAPRAARPRVDPHAQARRSGATRADAHPCSAFVGAHKTVGTQWREQRVGLRGADAGRTPRRQLRRPDEGHRVRKGEARVAGVPQRAGGQLRGAVAEARPCHCVDRWRLLAVVGLHEGAVEKTSVRRFCPQDGRGGSVTSGSSSDAPVARAPVMPAAEPTRVPLGCRCERRRPPPNDRVRLPNRPCGPRSQSSRRSRSERWAKNDAVVWKPASRREREEFPARPRGRRVIRYSDFG